MMSIIKTHIYNMANLAIFYTTDKVIPIMTENSAIAYGHSSKKETYWHPRLNILMAHSFDTKI